MSGHSRLELRVDDAVVHGPLQQARAEEENARHGGVGERRRIEGVVLGEKLQRAFRVDRLDAERSFEADGDGHGEGERRQQVAEEGDELAPPHHHHGVGDALEGPLAALRIVEALGEGRRGDGRLLRRQGRADHVDQREADGVVQPIDEGFAGEGKLHLAEEELEDGEDAHQRAAPEGRAEELEVGLPGLAQVLGALGRGVLGDLEGQEVDRLPHPVANASPHLNGAEELRQETRDGLGPRRRVARVHEGQQPLEAS